VAVFVLVHGAWGGAHDFRKVRRPLHSAGHEVFTPSLTGIGERAHLPRCLIPATAHSVRSSCPGRSERRSPRGWWRGRWR
jgi:dienelactone hydrolase